MTNDTNKKRLVILSTFYEPYMSGAERMAREIAKELGGKYEITLLAGLCDRSLPRIEERPTFRLVRLGIGHKQLDKILYVFLAAWQVRRLRPDIVHAIMESYAGGALALIKYIYPCAKRILTLQSGELDESRKQKQLFIKLFWKTIHTSPDKITAISTTLAQRAENLGVPRENIIITPNGVDFSEVPEKAEKVPHRVLCMGRLSWEKGYDFLLPAWKKVVAVVPVARLVIYGEGPEEAAVKKMITDLAIGDTVEVRKHIPHDEFIKEMAKAEVFVLPTLAEGLGIVFIEAQACGVPPIGSRVGGVPDVIQDEENGLLIEPKNTDAIADAVIRLLTDKELAAKIVKRGLETVKKYDWNIIMEQIDGIYKEILK